MLMNDRSTVYEISETESEKLELVITEVKMSDNLNETTTQSHELPKRIKRQTLPKSSKDLLVKWLSDNSRRPYPSEMEKTELSEQTNLTRLQIDNWFINARRRILPKIIDSKSSTGDLYQNPAWNGENCCDGKLKSADDKKKGIRDELLKNNTIKKTTNCGVSRPITNLGGMVGNHYSLEILLEVADYMREMEASRVILNN